METVYYKRNGKYIPSGIIGAPDLYEGIWLVEIEPGRKSSKNLVMRLSDLPNPKDLQLLAQVTMLEDTICSTILRVLDGGKAWSPAELAKEITKDIATTEVSTKLTSRKLRGS